MVNFYNGITPKTEFIGAVLYTIFAKYNKFNVYETLKNMYYLVFFLSYSVMANNIYEYLVQ